MLNRYLLAPLAALALLAATPQFAQAQTGGVRIGTAGTPDASAALDISSTSKGLLLPRLTLAQRQALTASPTAPPVAGLVIYQTDNTPGLYAFDGAAWVRLGADNLGNHTATQPLNLNGQKLTGGGTPGLRVAPDGSVAVEALAGTGQGRLVSVAPDGTLQASAPIQGTALASSSPDPVLLGTVAASFATPQTVGVNGAGTRAYVSGSISSGGGSGRLQAYDVSGSGAPVALGSPATTGYNAKSIAVNAAGTRAYVPSLNNSTLEAFDLSGGGTPVALGSPTPTASGPQDIALNAAGTRAYVVGAASLLQVFDVSGSGAPVLLSSAATGGDPVSVALNGAGTRAYVATGSDNTLEIYDVSGSVPTRLGSLIFDLTYSITPFTLAVNPAGTRAYLGYYGSSIGVLAFDVSANTPAQLGSPVSTAFPRDIAVNAAGTRAYVVTNGNVLRTYDLSGGGVPVLLGSPVSTGNTPVCLALNAAGTRAYVANLGGSLQVFGLGAAPTVVGIGSDGSLGTLTLAQLADNLGNHTATQNLNLAGYQLVSGGSTGLALTSAGNVGIGTTGPGQKLEVAGNVKITGTGNGLTFPDGSTQTSATLAGNLVGDITSTGTTTTYNNVLPAAKGGAGTVSGLLKANGSGLVSAATAGTDYLTPAGAAFTGRVGIATTTAQPATQLLDVRGNLRLGDDGGNSATGTGPALEWVGPGLNTDPVGLYRVNPASDQSELRVVVGDGADANDKFVVGRMPGTSTEGGIPTGTFVPNFTVRSDGSVGIGTGTPTSTLQVAGSVAAPIRALSSGTIADTDYTVIVIGNVSLPAPSAANTGRLYHIINGNTNTYTVTGTFHVAGSGGTLTSFLLNSTADNQGITVQSDGSQWWILTRE